jgi:hypothetical protein
MNPDLRLLRFMRVLIKAVSGLVEALRMPLNAYS